MSTYPAWLAAAFAPELLASRPPPPVTLARVSQRKVSLAPSLQLAERCGASIEEPN